MGKHVDGCQQSDVWKGSCTSSLGRVDDGIESTVELHLQVAQITAFP